MDRCDACPFVYADVAIADIPTEIRAWARILVEHLPADDPRIRTRPEPDVWSALEYTCHVRDALDVQRGRVALALAEDSPIFTPMGRDERAERDRYNDQDPAAVTAEVVAAADRFADALDELTPLEWERTGIYTWPNTESRSLAWVGRHTLHELHHHTADIDRSLRTSEPNGPDRREARLLLTCGLPGAGKTTLARQMAADRSAVRLTTDEWLWALGSTPWDAPTQEKVEHELCQLAQEILRLGLSVVLDFGLWARIERDEMRSVARGLGVGVELHYLDVPVDELWRRVDARNSQAPWDSHPIRRADLDGWLSDFQAPDAAELALFDAPPGAH